MRYAHGIAIVDHGNLGAWHVSSATAPATTVACMNDADVLDGLPGALDSHEFVLEQRLLDFGGCPWSLNSLQGSRKSQARIASLSICRKKNLTGAADAKTENTQTPPWTPPPDGNGITIFAAVTNIKA